MAGYMISEIDSMTPSFANTVMVAVEPDDDSASSSVLFIVDGKLEAPTQELSGVKKVFSLLLLLLKIRTYVQSTTTSDLLLPLLGP